MVVWLTWPLIRHCVDHLPDPVALVGFWAWTYAFDLQLVSWVLSWDVHALLNEPAHLFQANIFHPAPDPLAYSDHFLGLLPLAAPAYLASGSPVLALNAALLGCYLACALAMHALVVRWTGSHAAAFGAGVVYAFNAWRLAPTFSLQVVGAPYLPLVLLFWERWTARRRWFDLTAVSACLVLQTAVSYYLGYAAFLTIGLALTTAILLRRVGWRPLGLATLAVAAAALVVFWTSGPYLRLSASGVLRTPTLAELQISSARFGMLHPWLAGWSALLLAGVGVAVNRSSGARGLCLALVAGGTLFAAGPTLSIAGVTVPLPYRWLLDAVPGFAVIRYPARFVAVVILGFAGLVGLGLAAIATPSSIARRAGVATGVALLIWHAGATARMAVRRAPRAEEVSSVYRTLADTAEEGPLLEFPLSADAQFYREPEYVLLSTYHWKTLLNGYSGYVPPTYLLVRDAATRLPSPSALQQLVDLTALRWVVVHPLRGESPQAWLELERAGAVRRLAADARAILYEVALPPRVDLTERARRAVLEPQHETLLGATIERLANDALRSEWTVAGLPGRVRPQQPMVLRVAVRNVTDTMWPGYGVRAEGLVVIRARWLAADASAAIEAETIRLPRDLEPGGRAETEARLRAPGRPGHYTLELSLRQLLDGGAVGTPSAAGTTVVEQMPAPGRR